MDYIDIQNNVKTSIVIVSYNANYMMQKNIESIRNTLNKNEYHIYIVDNASTDGIAEWLKIESEKSEDISVLLNEENVGFPKACNQAVKLAEDEGDLDGDIFLLNNDTRLCQNSLKNLKIALYSNENVGATGSISNYAGNHQQVDIEFSLPSKYVEYGDRNNSVDPYDSSCWEDRVRLSGFAMLIRRDVWRDAGGMDELFSPGYFEDDDLSMKIALQGKRLLLCNNSFIYHAGSQSFSKVNNINTLLEDHYQMFIKKYGFPIIDYAYADTYQLSKIKYDANKECYFLHIGAGIGSNIKYLKSKYPNVKCYGVEKSEYMRNICAKTEDVYSSVKELQTANCDASFDVIYVEENVLSELTEEDIAILNDMLNPDCLILPNNSIDFSTIKLVIWDMDNTFWNGILSEGNIEVIDENIELVKKLTDCGIINSISSKNNEKDVMEKLSEFGIADYFVFNNINWDNKGEQIKNKLLDMNLRAENTLFIDDEIRNLEEVDYCNEGIIASDPAIICELISYIESVEKKDLNHKRLNEYKILESKRTAEKSTESKEKFLYDSDIYIEICADCENEVDRIAELVSRTNQLNFTKVRDEKSVVKELIDNKYIEKGYIKARDKFGDYGIVGFYCFDEKGALRHLLFSCRILGMGIEQKIYKMLGCPEIDIAYPVAVTLNKIDDCKWVKTNLDDAINTSKYSQEDNQNKIEILLKGPCDMSSIGGYLQGGDIITEFNYVNDLGFVTTGQNHTAHIVESVELKDADIDEITKTAPFITRGDFETSIFSAEYDVVCLSLLPDCEQGYYCHKKTGYKIAFGSKNFDLTDPINRNGYITGEIQNHGFRFTNEVIDKFSDEWVFEESIEPQDIINNLDFIINNIKGNPEIILVLGSEIEYEGNNAEFANLAERHAQVNKLVKEFANDKQKIHLIETTKYINSQDDYMDCINHFTRNVYYDMASEIVSIINDKVEEIAKNVNVEPYVYDALIMAVPNDYLRLEHLYQKLIDTLPVRKIKFVGNSKVGELVNESGLGNKLSFIDEDSILTFDAVHAVMKDALKDILQGRELPRGITGWYYQQFLKMGYSQICNDKYYLVWDGDTVPCDKFSMFRQGTDTPYFDLKTEYHEDYFNTISKLLPGMGKVIRKSFISEHMLMNAEYMRELIAVIESNDNIKGDNFYEKIIYSIEPEKLLSNSFSEFETYGTYIALRHMDAYALRDWHSFRYGGYFFDSKKISESDFKWLSKDFHAISFEKNHEVRDDMKNLFDNKEYQEKLSARQMLEIAQEEFKGDSFIESWD